MATQTESLQPDVLPSQAVAPMTPTVAKPATAEYWTQYLHSMCKPMLELSGAYTESERASHLKFLADHVAPKLGPLPSEPHSQYTMTYIDSPFEPSLNLSSSGKTKVRYEFEVMTKPGREGPDPFGESIAREVLLSMAIACKADTKWLESIMSALFLTEAEADTIRHKLPYFMPCSIMAFDLDGPDVMMKAYIPAVRKAVSTGRPSATVLLDAVRGLEPMGSEFGPGLDIIAEYLATCTHDAMLIFVGIDCVDPTINKKARVKVYLHTSSNAFSVVRDVMTLGGRLNDESSIKRIEMLKSIWPLALNEVDGEHAMDETWSKPDRVPGTPFSGLQYNIELSPGKTTLNTQLYVPMFQYAPSADVAEANLEAILKKLDHDWGYNGKFRDTMDTV